MSLLGLSSSEARVFSGCRLERSLDGEPFIQGSPANMVWARY